MKYEPIAEHSTIYKCPICGNWSESKQTIEECIKGHGEIPEFAKMLLHDLDERDFYPEPKPGLYIDEFIDLVEDGGWDEREKRDKLSSKLFEYELQIKKQLGLVHTLQEKIHQYEYCGK